MWPLLWGLLALVWEWWTAHTGHQSLHQSSTGSMCSGEALWLALERDRLDQSTSKASHETLVSKIRIQHLFHETVVDIEQDNAKKQLSAW